MGGRKPQLVLDGSNNGNDDDPSQWLGFSLPPRSAPTGLAGPPRRSKRGDAWRGSAMTREKFVNANFRFVLKPTEVLSYGAHFADPDIALHWPHILQILVPTFSAYSVAQGFVSSEGDDDADGVSGEEAAEKRRRVQEEKQGRTCPICLGKPVAGRMTKCGHVREGWCPLTIDILFPLYFALHRTVGRAKVVDLSHLRRHDTRGNAQERAVSRRGDDGQSRSWG